MFSGSHAEVIEDFEKKAKAKRENYPHKHGFKIIGALDEGNARDLSFKESASLMIHDGYRKQEEPERFWPNSKGDYYEWRRARVKEYFESYPSWGPFLEKWKGLSDEEKACHSTGLPGGTINEDLVRKIRETRELPEGEDKTLLAAAIPQHFHPEVQVQDKHSSVELAGIPNAAMGGDLTSVGTTNDIRGKPSCDKSRTCWEQFNDAYRCHLQGQPTSQCMNLLGVASDMCPDRWLDMWFQQIEDGNFYGNNTIRSLSTGNDHGHH